MKNLSFLILSVISVCSAHTSTAQNSILAGKILDENNNVVPRAEVKLHQQRSDKIYHATANSDGLYYTQILPSGNYVVEVSAKNTAYRTEVILPPMDKATKYHDLSLKGNSLRVSVHDNNPFMQAVLGKLQREIPTHDFLEETRYGPDGIPQQNMHRMLIEKN